MQLYYAPTFIDESLTRPDRRGEQHSTGRLSGIVIGRKFFKSRAGKIRAERMVISFSWEQDTQEAKAEALAKVIEGMEEMPELDNNPPLSWIPAIVKQKDAANEVPQEDVR
jgi:hypothetical protein